MSAKVCSNVFPNVLKERKLTSVPLTIITVIIPDYGQSNATYTLCPAYSNNHR